MVVSYGADQGAPPSDSDTWVFAANGLVDDVWASSLGRTVRQAEVPAAVIDLTHAVLVARQPLARALRSIVRDGPGDASTPVAVVCPRLSAVALLRRWGLLGAVSLHLTLEEALDRVADQQGDAS